jgi:hypothetical protein
MSRVGTGIWGISTASESYASIGVVPLVPPVGLLPLEILPEGLVHDLRVGHAVEVRLPADRVFPALLDEERDAPGLSALLLGLLEGCLAVLSPGNQFLEFLHHIHQHIVVDTRSTLCRYGRNKESGGS